MCLQAEKLIALAQNVNYVRPAGLVLCAEPALHAGHTLRGLASAAADAAAVAASVEAAADALPVCRLTWSSAHPVSAGSAAVLAAWLLLSSAALTTDLAALCRTRRVQPHPACRTC